MTDSIPRPNTLVTMTAPTDDNAAFFRTTYDTQLGWLLRTLRRLGAHPRDIEDLAHDVLCTMFRRLPDFDRSRPVRPWLYGIAVRVVADYRRRAAHTREGLPGDVDPMSAAPGPDADLEAAQQRALVLNALDTLSDEQRAVLVAHDLDGTPIPELVDVLEAPLNTLYSRLRAARQRFAAAIERLLDPGEAA
jgi:RNA polymerase sigma-70 factor (ECF subfamily)